MSDENSENKNVKQEEVELNEEIKTENEGIKISDDVVAVIAGVIKADINENNAKIDVNIIVEYGSRIPDVAFEIQNRVKKAVESMTGLKVEEVNVHVQGVNTDTASDNEEKSEADD